MLQPSLALSLTFFLARLICPEAKPAIDSADQLVTLLRTLCATEAEAKEAEGDLRALGETLCASLREMLKADDESVDPAEIDQAEGYAAKALRGLEIGPATLLERALDVSGLATDLRDSIPAEASALSLPARDYLERLLNASAERLVMQAKALPAVQGEALVAILRETRAQGKEHLAATAQFVDRYRAVVRKRLDYVDLIGVSALSPEAERQKLSVAYVTLSLCESDSRHGQQTGEGETVSAEQMIAGRKRILVRGPAGSGKTTLLKWLAVQTAAKRFGQALDEWNRMVPFFVQLRDWAQSEKLPRPEEFVAAAADVLDGEAPPGWVRELLARGEAVVLVDGVDELADWRREQVREWMADVLVAFPQTAIVVTSREAAVREGWLDSEGFATFNVEPMGKRDVELLVDYWHKAVGLTAEFREHEDLFTLRDGLKETLRKSGPLRNLARTPLLCAMLCALNRDRRSNLPEERIELYEACCQMLLDRRDPERRILRDPNCQYAMLSYLKKKHLLVELAYNMVANGHLFLTKDDMDLLLRKSLPAVLGPDHDVDIPRFRQRMVERSGLLQERTVNQIQFPHRTFQEYLAAQAAVQGQMIKFLIENAEREKWREVVVLAAGLGSPSQTTELVRGLCDRAEDCSDIGHGLLVTAFACLETGTALDPTVRERVKEKVSSLVPPQSPPDARALAGAGDRVVPLLQYNKSWRARELAEAGRALSLIGTDAALTALAPYVRLRAAPVVAAVCEAADEHPDIDAFIECVMGPTLKEFPHLAVSVGGALRWSVKHRMFRLVVPEQCELRFLKKLQTLGRLVLSGLPNWGGKQAGVLSAMPGLQALEVYRLRALDQSALQCISQVPALERLKLSNLEQLSGSLSPLKDMHMLRSLVLRELPEIRGDAMITVGELTQLRQLVLRSLPRMRGADLQALAGLRDLERLELSDLRSVQAADLEFIGSMPQLTQLRLSGLAGFTSKHLGVLQPLKELRYLELTHMSGVRDFTSMPKLPVRRLVLDAMAVAPHWYREPVDKKPRARQRGRRDR